MLTIPSSVQTAIISALLGLETPTGASLTFSEDRSLIPRGLHALKWTSERGLKIARPRFPVRRNAYFIN